MNLPNLPDGYELTKEVDLKKDKKLAVWLNAASLVLAAAVLIPVMQCRPLTLTFGPNQNWFAAMAPLPASLLFMILYVFAHELTHGFFFKQYSRQKVTYSFHFLFASAGSPDYYYDKKAYLVIGLSPIVLLGLLLCIPLFFLQGLWFWSVFMVQVVNIGGAAGDLYVAGLLLTMPGDILVNDNGMRMRFYGKP